MKRKYVDKWAYPRIKVIQPIFWKLCMNCKYEYKKEEMYQIKDEKVSMGGWLYVEKYYLCKNCVKTKEEALRKYNELTW